jgi:hypothetical protein
MLYHVIFKFFCFECSHSHACHMRYSFIHAVACRVQTQQPIPHFKFANTADILDSVLLDNGDIPKDLVIVGVTGTYKLILSSKVTTSTVASTGELRMTYVLMYYVENGICCHHWCGDTYCYIIM